MGSQAKDLTGQSFGKLKVVARAPSDHRLAIWTCVCSCGNSSVRVVGSDLRRGHTESCGCLRWDTTPPEKQDRETIPERIRRLRLEKKLTQAQLAERLGYSADDIVSHWEAWRRTPPTEHIPTLAKIFGVTSDYLLTGKESSRLVALQQAILMSPKRDERLVAMVRGGA